MKHKIQVAGTVLIVLALSAGMNSAAQATFTSANYPATASGTSTGDVFDMFGSTLKCTNNSFTSSTITKATEVIDIYPKFQNCTGFGLGVTVNWTSCFLRITHPPSPTPSETHIVCSVPGDAIDEDVYPTATHGSAICHVRIPAQSSKSGLSFSNSGGKVIISGTLGGLTATQSRTSIVLCPPGTHTTSASYTVQAGGISFTGNNGALSVD